MDTTDPIRVTLTPSISVPDQWTVKTPSAQVTIQGRANATAWARDHLVAQVAGGWLMVVDTVGLAVSNEYVAAASIGAVLGGGAVSAPPPGSTDRSADGARPSLRGHLDFPSQPRAGHRVPDLVETREVALGTYWSTREPLDGPFTVIDKDLRLRRQSSFVIVETPLFLEGEGNGWARWWVDPTDGAALISVESVMTTALELGKREGGTPAARFLEQTAPELVGLARYSAGNVDGTSVAALHFRPRPDVLVTVLVVPLSAPLPQVIDRAWVDQTLLAPSLAMTVAQACARLDQSLQACDAATLESFRRSAVTDWQKKLATAGSAARDIKALWDLGDKVWKLFSDG